MKEGIRDIGKIIQKKYFIPTIFLCLSVFMLLFFHGCVPCCPVIESFSYSPAGARPGDTVTLSFEICWFERGNTSGDRCEAELELVQFRYMPSGVVVSPVPDIDWTVTRGGGCDPVYCYRGTARGVRLREGDNRIQIRVSAEEDCPHRPVTREISY